jgi:hypothetical protein
MRAASTARSRVSAAAEQGEEEAEGEVGHGQREERVGRPHRRLPPPRRRTTVQQRPGNRAARALGGHGPQAPAVRCLSSSSTCASTSGPRCTTSST